MKPTCKNITKYINQRLDKLETNNISISLPKLNKSTLEALRQNFKVVRSESFLGYIHFER